MLVTFGQYNTYGTPIRSERSNNTTNLKPESENEAKVRKGLEALCTTAKAILPEKGKQFPHIRKQVNLDTIQRPSGAKQIDTIIFTIQPSQRDITPDDRVLKVRYCAKDDPDICFAFMPKSPIGPVNHLLEQLQTDDLVKEVLKELANFNMELDPSYDRNN